MGCGHSQMQWPRAVGHHGAIQGRPTVPGEASALWVSEPFHRPLGTPSLDSWWIQQVAASDGLAFPGVWLCAWGTSAEPGQGSASSGLRQEQVNLPYLLSDPPQHPCHAPEPPGARCKAAATGITEDPENKQAGVCGTLLGTAQSGTVGRYETLWSHHLPTPGLSPSAHQVRLLDELRGPVLVPRGTSII